MDTNTPLGRDLGLRKQAKARALRERGGAPQLHGRGQR